MSLRTDEELVVAIPNDAEAFTELYRRHVRMVLGYLMRRTGDPEQAADLTAEVFAAVLLQAGRFRPGAGDARGWLLSIARHKQVDAWRRGAVEDAARRRLSLRRVEVDEGDLAAIAALGDDVQVLLRELPDDQRDAVAGRIVDDQSYRELADQAGVTPAAVRQRVSRGLAALRARMEDR